VKDSLRGGAFQASPVHIVWVAQLTSRCELTNGDSGEVRGAAVGVEGDPSVAVCEGHLLGRLARWWIRGAAAVFVFRYVMLILPSTEDSLVVRTAFRSGKRL
jgi:hypothetical protein